MRVNSNALLARKMIVTRKFGAEAWNQIFKCLARVHPCLRAPLTASSQVPLAEFLVFNEELVDRLYGGDAKSTGRRDILARRTSRSTGSRAHPFIILSRGCPNRGGSSVADPNLRWSR